MGIDGKMRMLLSPYHNKYYDGSQKFEELKRSLTKFSKSEGLFVSLPWKSTIIKPPYNPCWQDRPDRKSIIIDIPDNRNFWCQLVMIPILLIPYFWKMSKEEIEAKRLELIKNDAWVIENIKALSIKIRGTISVFESYDSSAEGEYSYLVGHDGNDKNPTAEPLRVSEGYKTPDHANALRLQIEAVKHAVSALGGRITKSPKESYWGLFK